MRLKTLLITIAVLAVLAIAVAVVRRPSAPVSSDPRIHQPLVDAALIEKASQVRITDAGKTVELSRQADNTWRVASYHGLPADFSKLSTFVKNLTDAKLQRLVTTNPERIARLEFKDTEIQLLDAAGKELWSATLGKTAETGGRFVRFGDEPKAYLANLQAYLDVEPKNWANSALVTLKPEEIAKIELSFPGDKPVILSRAKAADPWTADQTPEQQSLDTSKVSSILSSLGTIRFSDTTDPNDPKVAEAKAQTRNARLTTFDGKHVSLTFARKAEEKKLKPPSPTTDGTSGPAALGSVADLKANEPAPQSGETPAETPKPIAPEYETIPAGPVFLSVTHSDENAPVNELMKKRAFQVSDYTFTSLPQSRADLFKSTAPQP